VGRERPDLDANPVGSRSKYVAGLVRKPPPDRWPGDRPDDPSQGDDACCNRLLKQLEQQATLLTRILEAQKAPGH
jgi:hypothetical protein